MSKDKRICGGKRDARYSVPAFRCAARLDTGMYIKLLKNMPAASSTALQAKTQIDRGCFLRSFLLKSVGR